MTTFHRDLDAAFLTQRTLLPQPEDASEFLISLIVSELHTILEENELGKHAGAEVIQMWLRARFTDEKHFKFGDKELTLDDITLLIIEGKYKTMDAKQLDGFRDTLSKKLTSQLALASASSSDTDAELAMLTTIQTPYQGRSAGPILTLGTVVRDWTDSPDSKFIYWLCIQPRCDSVRLEEETNFPFLPYEINPKKFDLIIKEQDGTFVYLKLLNEPSKTRVLGFLPSPDASKVIRAVKQDESFLFETVDHYKFRWVADLRPVQAQRVIQRFASEISRVGVDESEWMRRSPKR